MENTSPPSTTIMDQPAQNDARTLPSAVDSLSGHLAQRATSLKREFDGLGQRFQQKRDDLLRDLQKQIDESLHSTNNITAKITNRQLHRMGHSIDLIKVRRSTSDPNRSEWASHPEAPKRVKNTVCLAQHAKGFLSRACGTRQTNNVYI